MLIAVINQKGGVGKTTLAVHLAVWLLDRGRNVAFIDADGQLSATVWLRKCAPNLRVLPAPDAGTIAEAVGILKPHVDVIVADGPPGLDVKTQALLGLSDLVLTPLGPSVLDMRATMQAVKMIEAVDRSKDSGPATQAWAVLNRGQSGTNATRTAKQYLAALGVQPATTHLSLRAAFTEAVLQNTVVTRMTGPLAKAAADEIDALFNEVLPDGIKERQERTDGSGAAGGDRPPAGRRRPARSTGVAAGGTGSGDDGAAAAGVRQPAA